MATRGSLLSPIKENNLKVTIIKNVDKNKNDINKNKIKNISDDLFKKFYTIKKENMPEVLKINNKYFLVELLLVENKDKPLNDPDVLKALKAQLNFQKKIENNTSILKDISMGGFGKTEIEKFADKNNLELKDYKISNIKQNEIFSEEIIKRIFLTKNNKVDLITNSRLTKNFLILAVNTEYKKLDKSSSEFERYTAKARLDLINMVYKNFDDQLNEKYKVDLNQRTIERVKNSF